MNKGDIQFAVRNAEPRDAENIAKIYNQGIEDGIATFETVPRSRKDIEKWFDGVHPIVVGELGSNLVGFASTSAYSYRECYRGIAEFSVYVERELRGSGIGKALMERLISEAERYGFWKLVSRIFTENTRSRKLMDKLGFREVGIYKKHAMLKGKWRDVVIVELILSKNITSN